MNRWYSLSRTRALFTCALLAVAPGCFGGSSGGGGGGYRDPVVDAGPSHCTSHAECPESQTCAQADINAPVLSRSCIPKANVLYLQPEGKCAPGRGSSLADPACGLGAIFTSAVDGKVIRLLGGNYGVLTMAAGTRLLVGPDAGAPPAEFSSVSVSKDAALQLDRVLVRPQDPLERPAQLVSCEISGSVAPTLRVMNTQLLSARGLAVRSIGCNLTLEDGTKIADSAGAALYVKEGRFRISRCQFRGNHSPARAAVILLSPGADSTIEDCDFVDNTNDAKLGGAIACPDGQALSIRRPFLSGNTIDPAIKADDPRLAQVQGRCSLEGMRVTGLTF